MSVKVFYIPPRYRGSTETLLKVSGNRIKGSDYSGILYIAPTPRKVRDSQRIFHGLTKGCYIPPLMMTIKQFSKKLYSLYGDRKVVSQLLIPIIISQTSSKGIGFSSLLRDFFNEIKQYHPGKDIETIRKELQDIFHELGIPEEISTMAMEAMGVFKEYQEILEKAHFLDEDDVMIECPRLIKEHNYSPEIVILDGFYDLTKSEEVILKILIENAGDTFISIINDSNYYYITDSYNKFINNNFNVEVTYLSTQEKDEEPFYHPYSGIEEEVEGIVRSIKNYFISGKIRDLEKIIITFPKLYEYSDLLKRVCRRYGIPYTLSTSKPVGKSRPFLDLIALLESIANDYPRLPFSSFLTSPYFKNLPSEFNEWIPMLSLRSGLVKGRDEWLSINEAVENNRLVINADVKKRLRWVFKKLTLLETIKNSSTFSQFGEVIDKLLKAFDFSGIDSQDEDIKEMASSALRELSFIDTLIPTNRNLLQFIDALKHILNATEIEIEGTGVQVMGFLELRGIEAEYLYFGGLKEGDLPSKPDIDHILPDSVRKKFGLITLKKYLLLQEFIFNKTIKSSRNLHLSYPVMEGNKLFLPSPFLPWNKKKVERVPGIFSKEEALLRRGKEPFTSYITDIGVVGKKFMRDNFGENAYIRVTDIDSYRICPRKFFIEKVLQLEPPEIKEYKVEATFLGTIAHEIMQRIVSKPLEDLVAFRIRAEEIINTILFDKPLEKYWKNLIRDSFISILPEIYELEKSLLDDGYSFMKGEFPVKGEIIKGIKLKGTIDRVDRKAVSSQSTTHGRSALSGQKIEHVIELIDYKTGTTKFSGLDVRKKGTTLQLFIYAALMKMLGINVKRVGIYSLKDINLSWIPSKNDGKDGRTIEDYIGISLNFLEKSVSRMRKVDFSASPLDDYTCVICSERSYCPYIQKTAKS